MQTGEVATYIPELSKADPEHFGVCLVTADGRTFEAGDCDRPFTIQSISKPFTYGMALEEFGPAKVFEHVGVEPSGDVFNSIELQNGTNRPFNPMINSGAITVTALLHARYGNRTFEYLLDRFSVIAGRQLSLDRAVYESERRTGHRNRAIAHLLLNFGLVHEEAEAALDVYFKQCSIHGDLSRPRDDGSDAVQHGTASGHRTQRLLDHARQGHALDHVHVRDVRLLGPVGVSRRRASQERRQRRRDHRREPAARDRHLLAAPGSVREQLPRHGSLRRPGVTSRLARVRLPERRIELSGRDSLSGSSVTATGASYLPSPSRAIIFSNPWRDSPSSRAARARRPPARASASSMNWRSN